MKTDMVLFKAAPVGRGPSVDPEIGRQRVESLAKDAEARGKVGNGGILLRDHFKKSQYSGVPVHLCTCELLKNLGVTGEGGQCIVRFPDHYFWYQDSWGT